MFSFFIIFLPLAIHRIGPIIPIITISIQVNFEPLNCFVKIKYIALKVIIIDQKHIIIIDNTKIDFMVFKNTTLFMRWFFYRINCILCLVIKASITEKTCSLPSCSNLKTSNTHLLIIPNGNFVEKIFEGFASPEPVQLNHFKVNYLLKNIHPI